MLQLTKQCVCNIFEDYDDKCLILLEKKLVNAEIKYFSLSIFIVIIDVANFIYVLKLLTGAWVHVLLF